MSETPQEILDRAAPIWDRHVVSFTRVLAALRSVLAERDALRADVERLERARLRSADWLTFEKMEAEVERLREIMRRLVHGIDEWNASVEPIIGRPVDYKWLALEEARAALTPAEEGWGYDTETGEEGKS